MPFPPFPVLFLVTEEYFTMREQTLQSSRDSRDDFLAVALECHCRRLFLVPELAKRVHPVYYLFMAGPFSSQQAAQTYVDTVWNDD